jgi:hypothetical protein
VGEVMPFIDEILNNINTIICDLQPQQVCEGLSILFLESKDYVKQNLLMAIEYHFWVQFKWLKFT